MTKVKVLIEGYARKIEEVWVASSTTVLIDDRGKRIIVDPGINKRLLLKTLEGEGLSTDDIDIVFMTHYHPDHAFLAAIFPEASVLDGDTIYKEDEEVGYQGVIPGTTIRVIPTPGHAHEHSALLIDTEKGKVVIAADVFWWTDEEDQIVTDAETLISRGDPFVKDQEALKESREKILKIADWIIPGHGRMFKNPNPRK